MAENRQKLVLNVAWTLCVAAPWLAFAAVAQSPDGADATKAATHRSAVSPALQAAGQDVRTHGARSSKATQLETILVEGRFQSYNLLQTGTGMGIVTAVIDIP